MNIITRPNKLRGIESRIGIEKISRRSVLKGLGIAGGLVLAAPVTSRLTTSETEVMQDRTASLSTMTVHAPQSA